MSNLTELADKVGIICESLNISNEDCERAARALRSLLGQAFNAGRASQMEDEGPVLPFAYMPQFQRVRSIGRANGEPLTEWVDFDQGFGRLERESAIHLVDHSSWAEHDGLRVVERIIHEKVVHEVPPRTGA